MIYIKLLNNHTEYSTFSTSSDFITPNITLCNAEQHMHYNPEIIISASLLDILYSDVNGNLSYTSEILPISEGKTPIALCIAGTNFFGANEPARWMSLKYMNYDTPEIGSLNSQAIYQGTLNNDTTNPNIKKLYNTTEGYGYLTADWITGTYNKIPSLYDIDNNWNLTQLGTINESIVTDINGKTNTRNILLLATGQANWQTDTSITNMCDNNYAPAACCCARYHTLGTQAGDWYLGACGEQTMILTYKTKINEKTGLIECEDIYPSLYYEEPEKCPFFYKFFQSNICRKNIYSNSCFRNWI